MNESAKRLAWLAVLLWAAGVSEATGDTAAQLLHLAPMTWPWAWGKAPLELHLIRLRFDAGERTARAYLRIGEIAGKNLQASMVLASLGPEVGQPAALEPCGSGHREHALRRRLSLARGDWQVCSERLAQGRGDNGPERDGGIREACASGCRQAAGTSPSSR